MATKISRPISNHVLSRVMNNDRYVPGMFADDTLQFHLEDTSIPRSVPTPLRNVPKPILKATRSPQINMESLVAIFPTESTEFLEFAATYLLEPASKEQEELLQNCLLLADDEGVQLFVHDPVPREIEGTKTRTIRFAGSNGDEDEEEKEFEYRPFIRYLRGCKWYIPGAHADTTGLGFEDTSGNDEVQRWIHDRKIEQQRKMDEMNRCEEETWGKWDDGREAAEAVGGAAAATLDDGDDDGDAMNIDRDEEFVRVEVMEVDDDDEVEEIGDEELVSAITEAMDEDEIQSMDEELKEWEAEFEAKQTVQFSLPIR